MKNVDNLQFLKILPIASDWYRSSYPYVHLGYEAEGYELEKCIRCSLPIFVEVDICACYRRIK